MARCNMGCPPLDLITFYTATDLNEIPYQAEKEMTWEQFINSKYNTENWYIDEDNRICDNNGGRLAENFDSTLYPTKDEMIIKNYLYQWGI